jgi:transposase
MVAVVIGVDPHKRSNTALVLDGHEKVLAQQRFDNDRDGHRALKTFARQWRDRTWAVEGARGVGLGLAQRLAAEGERVINVPAKLSARVRALGGGSGRKTDDTDAYAIAVAGLRGRNLELVEPDDVVTVMKLLSDRRQQLVEQRIAAVNRLHQLLQDLMPGGASRRLTATRARELLSAVRPRDQVGKARKQLALEHIDDLQNLDTKLKAIKTRITAILKEQPSAVTDICGLGVVTTALILGEVGDVRRFPSKAHFASYTAQHPSTQAAATPFGTASIAVETAGSTTPCTSRRSSRPATPVRAAPTTAASSTPARHHWKRCAASSDDCPMSSSEPCWTTLNDDSRQRAREDNRGRLFNPARLAQPRQPALRTSHFPDPPARTLRPSTCLRQHPLDREGSP